MSNTDNEKILLGYGVFKIADVTIGLTRGGGTFEVEIDYREVVADGDYGPVKGRVVKDREVGSLTINALTAFSKEQFLKYYPGLEEEAGKITPTLNIKEGDYHKVTWVGKTMSGRPITIEMDNALNMEGISLSLEDKNEVVPELKFTATYDPATRTKVPWSITFGADE